MTKNNWIRFATGCLVAICTLEVSALEKDIKPGAQWNDTSGKPINAHGSCVVYDKGTYYWFGENRDGFLTKGIGCYSSKDLYNWENLGLVLPMSGTAREDLNDISDGRLFERPKVIYNAKTKKWVMWIHWEKNSHDYGAARVCVATADKVTGPYQLYKTFRPNGHDSRDQTVFVALNGKAYHFGSTDMNTNMNVAQLRDDYLEPTVQETKILNEKRCEAPAIFQVGDIYYGLFSGCTGWDPNPGRKAYTFDVLGKWEYSGINFATDEGQQTTYQSQSAYVFKVAGKENAYVYVGDRWNPKSPGSSLQVWLPISMRSGYPTVRWHNNWDISFFDQIYRYKRAKAIYSDNIYSLLEKNSDRLVSKCGNKGLTLEDDNDGVNLSFKFIKIGEDTYKIKEMKSGNYLESVFGTIRLNPENNKNAQLWIFKPQKDGYYKISNKDDGKYISVSGASTLAGTGLYLAPASNRVSQDFAVYFDSDIIDYEEADIFAISYWNME